MPRVLRVTEYFAKSVKVIRNDTLEYGISITLYIRLYLVPFLRYSATTNGVTLKSGLEVTRGHRIWYRWKALARFPIQFAFHSNYGRVFSRFDTTHERDGHQTDTARRYRPRLRIAARGENSDNTLMCIVTG